MSLGKGWCNSFFEIESKFRHISSRNFNAQEISGKQWDIPKALFQYSIRRLVMRFHDSSQLRDRIIQSPNRFEILQLHRQRSLSNLRALREFWTRISRLLDLARYSNETSYLILKPPSEARIPAGSRHYCTQIPAGGNPSLTPDNPSHPRKSRKIS